MQRVGSRSKGTQRVGSRAKGTQRVGSRAKGTQRVGSRAQVMHGNAKMTGGGLKKKDLKYNKQGKIVSKKMSTRAKKEKRLQKAGYITKKGGFKLFKKQSGGGLGHSKSNGFTNNSADEYIIFNSRDTNENFTSITNGITINNNETVEVLEELTNTSKRDRFDNYMVKIKYKGNEGYVRRSNLYKKYTTLNGTTLNDMTVIGRKKYEKGIDIEISSIEQDGTIILCSVLDIDKKLLGLVSPDSLDCRVPIIKIEQLELIKGDTYSIIGGKTHGETGTLVNFNKTRAELHMLNGSVITIPHASISKTNLVAMAHVNAHANAHASFLRRTAAAAARPNVLPDEAFIVKLKAKNVEFYNTAYTELSSHPYKKKKCWLWYIFPGPPYNSRTDSSTTKEYSIKNLNTLMLYIADDILKKNYIKMIEAVNIALTHKSILKVMVHEIDVTKLKRSLIFFFWGCVKLSITGELPDECAKLFTRIKDDMDTPIDVHTIDEHPIIKPIIYAKDHISRTKLFKSSL
jgi:uncharacterized protein (DUF1810 family)